MSLSLQKTLQHTFEEHFAGTPRIALAPGRVNLIGEHTDYNDGYVFPMAIDRHIGIAFSPRPDNTLRVHAADLNDTCSIDLQNLQSRPSPNWARYPAGMAWALQQDGATLRGLNAVVSGTLPIGAGLSSSAALEMASGLAFATSLDLDCPPTRLAQLGQRAENEYVGVSCGIMDQYASALSEQDMALLLDCRSLDTTPVPLPDFLSVLVMDSGVRRSLTDGAYNERHAQCRKALRHFQEIDPTIKALRDVSPSLLEREESELSDLTYRRARHVVHETRRPRRMGEAFRQGNASDAGRLMNASHQSLRDLYDVSSPELNALVERAQEHPNCYGARLTGAGLGGCAIALVDQGYAPAVATFVKEAYTSGFEHEARFWNSRPVKGTHLAEPQQSTELD
jgi:galactokinase